MYLHGNRSKSVFASRAARKGFLENKGDLHVTPGHVVVDDDDDDGMASKKDGNGACNDTSSNEYLPHSEIDLQDCTTRDERCRK